MRGYDQNRINHFAELEKYFDSPVIAVVHCAWNPALNTQLALDTMAHLEEQLLSAREASDSDTVTLLIRSLGGQLNTPLPMHSLARAHFKSVNCVVVREAISAATLVAIGANKIYMGPSACLGPIDPQISLNSGPNVVKGGVEDIKGYMELVKDFLENDTKVNAFQALVNRIPPEVLGKIKRIEREIQFIADKLLTFAGANDKEKIIDYLGRQIPSHDYRIYRNEAKEIGLNIDFLDDAGALDHLNQLQKSFSYQMYEGEDITVEGTGGPLQVQRAFIESARLSIAYVSELAINIENQKAKKIDLGWKKVHPDN